MAMKFHRCFKVRIESKVEDLGKQTKRSLGEVKKKEGLIHAASAEKQRNARSLE